jgi:hypothetical protein
MSICLSLIVVVQCIYRRLYISHPEGPITHLIIYSGPVVCHATLSTLCCVPITHSRTYWHTSGYTAIGCTTGYSHIKHEDCLSLIHLLTDQIQRYPDLREVLFIRNLHHSTDTKMMDSALRRLSEKFPCLSASIIHEVTGKRLRCLSDTRRYQYY